MMTRKAPHYDPNLTPSWPWKAFLMDCYNIVQVLKCEPLKYLALGSSVMVLDEKNNNLQMV